MPTPEAQLQVEQLRDEKAALSTENADLKAQLEAKDVEHATELSDLGARVTFHERVLKKLNDMDAAALKRLSPATIAANQPTPGGAGWTEPGDAAFNVLMGTVPVVK